jgi:polygalacturonase
MGVSLRVREAAAWSLDDFQAIRDKDSVHAALHNVQSFTQAIMAANASVTDKTVIIPEGSVYYMGELWFEKIVDVTIQLDGKILFSDNFLVWGQESDSMICFENSRGLTVHGSGVMDGQGLKWWRMAYTGKDKGFRPKLMRFRTTVDILIYGVTFLNSPSFHVIFEDVLNVEIHDIEIFVNSSITRFWSEDSVTYALNTDGLDIRGNNLLIYNNKITNYDDAIVIKPCRNDFLYCTCSGDAEIYNNSITYSTGLSIGSISPGINEDCIHNVTFRDSYLYRPLKAIYIKPNGEKEGDEGHGSIDGITYENILIEQAIWWTVWIGPQQMNQPGDEASKGCNFLYPYIPVCPTQPLVSMTNIKLINITAINTLPLFEGPGVILCDPGNKCEDFVFDRVTNQMFPGDADDIIKHLPFSAPGFLFPTPYRNDTWEFEYLTMNVYGTVKDSFPTPCFNDPTCFTTLS